MKQSKIGGVLFALLACAGAIAQVGTPGTPQNGAPSISTGSVPLTYTGGDTSIGIGIDKDGNSQGDLMGVFGNNGEHAIVAQFWWENGGAGGAQADYNWLWGMTAEQAKDDPDSITVAKLSFALDQNATKDRQATVGFAIERKEFFLNFFLGGNVSGSRNAGTVTSTEKTMQTGTDSLGNFIQTETELTTTALQAQPFSYTVGVHGGHFSDPLTARFNGGFDYSRGNQGAHELRSSIGIDKYLGTRGWSISATAEHSDITNPLAPGGGASDNRWWMFVRYEFGGGGAFTSNASQSSAAWLQRALRNPVTGHSRDVQTYVTKGKTTKTTTTAPKQYTALRPIAHDDAANLLENSSANVIDVLANDSDPEGGALTITAAGAPANGTAQIAGTRVTYTPAAGFVGTDQFTYTIKNTKGLTATATVHATVNAAEALPVPQDDAATTPFGSAITIKVLANDRDPNGFALTVAGVTTPEHGTVRINTDGTLTYTPVPGFSGSDQFSYTITDGHGGTATAHVTIVVQAPLPPIARNDAATTSLATPVVVAVLANDSEPNGYALSVTSVSTPANGTAKLNADGTITYSPQRTFTGSDTFTYSIGNGHGGTATATVNISIVPPAPPIANDDTAATAYATAVDVYVLSNDTDPNKYFLTVTSASVPGHGSAVVNPTGTITYTPQAGFSGSDTFSYTISNGHGGTASANVTVTVQQPNAPLAAADSAATPFNTPVVISVLANDTDPKNLPLSVTQVTTPPNGIATINGNGTVTYTPKPTFSGTDTFNYTVSNGSSTASAKVTVTVAAPPPPVAQPDSATTAFKTPVSISVLTNDSDPNNLALSVSQVTQPANGTAAINSNGTITYTPQGTFTGSDSFNYTVTNGGATASAKVSVTVQAPLPPVAVNDSASTPFGVPVTVNVLANDSDPQALPLSVVSITQPTVGSAVLNANGTVTFTPNVELSGVSTFSYTITDGFNTATANVDVTVAAVLPPIAKDDSASVLFGQQVVISVLANDSDPQNFPLTVVSTTGSSFGGIITINNDGTITYQTNAESMSGPDTFTYTISDGFNTATATVTVTVNLPAMATAGGFSDSTCIANGTPCNICLDSHIANPAGLYEYIGVSLTTETAAGTSVQVGTSPGCTSAVVYTADTGKTFVDGFTYTITDNFGRMSSAAVTLNVSAN